MMQRFITSILFSLLLLAAQAGTLAHAAEHPFHAHDEACISYASFEKHDLAHVAFSPAACLHRIADSAIPLGTADFIRTSCRFQYARAPPSGS